MCVEHCSLFLFVCFTTFHAVWALRNSLSWHPPLRCCYMNEPPISFRNRQNHWNNGLDGVIKDHLLQHQAYLNWSCSNMTLFHQTDTTDFNAFVTSIYECTNKSSGQIIDSPNCSCDIGIGGWFQTPDRFRKVDFLPPFAFDQYVAFIHVSQATVSGNVWFFLQTFDRMAWICILGLFTMFSFLKVLDTRFAVAVEYKPPPKTYGRIRRYIYYLTKTRLLYRLRKACQSTVMRMLMLSDEPVVENGKSTRQWFLNIIVGVCALFLVLSYDSSMTASLVQESIEAKFQSAADLQNCRIDPSEMCVLRGGALETYWNNSIAVDECHFQNPPQYFNSYKTLFQAVEDRRCKYGVVIKSAITSAIRKRYCGHFVIVGQPMSGGGLSMLLPKGSNLTEIMSLATLELQRSQTISYVMTYFNNLPQCEAEVSTTLSFAKLRMFFIIAFVVGLVIFLAMVLIPQRSLTENGGNERAIPPEDDSTEAKSRCSKASSSSSEHSSNESPV